VLARGRFSVYCHLLQTAFTDESFVVTTLVLVALASCAVAALVVLVLRAVRLRGTADVAAITVSRQWLIQHQSNDRL